MRIIALIAVAGLCLPITGCTVFHVYQSDAYGVNERPIISNDPSTEWKFKKKNSIFWGGIQQHTPIENCKLGNGERTNIEEVVVKTNAIDSLIAIGTLGLWVRADIGWRCATPKVISGTIEPEDPETTDPTQ